MSTQKLDELIPQFAEHKEQEGQLKKLCDSENTQIKELMASEGIKKYESCGYQVNYIESVREKMNEEKLLELLHKHFSKKQLKELKLIKTVEQVDENALEDAIYHNIVKDDFINEMTTCKESSTVISLKLTKKKEK